MINKKKINLLYIPILLILLGLFWRLFQLNNFLGGIYAWDENNFSITRISNFWYSTEGMSKAWVTTSIWYSLVYYNFGITPLVGRIASVLISFFGILGLFLFVKKCWNWQVAIWSIALYSVSLYSVYFS